MPEFLFGIRAFLFFCSLVRIAYLIWYRPLLFLEDRAMLISLLRSLLLMAFFLGILFFGGMAFLFLLPSAVAFWRRHPHKIPILLLNLFFAYHFAVWGLALIWAFLFPSEPVVRVRRTHTRWERVRPTPSTSNDPQEIIIEP